MTFSFTPEIAFSSELKEFTIYTSDASADVEIHVDGIGYIYRQQLYSYNGRITLYELDTLIEDAMRAAGLTLGNLSFSVLAEGRKFERYVLVVCCTQVPLRAGNTAQWLQENFLSLSDMRRLRWEAPVNISAVLAPTEAALWKVSFKASTTDGEPVTGSYEVRLDDGGSDWDLIEFYLDKQLLLQKAQEAAEGAEIATVDMVTVRCGARVMYLYFSDEMRHAALFEFKNAFNVRDFVSFPGQKSGSSEVSVSEARLPDRVLQYDRRVLRSYKMVWPAITLHDSYLVDDFLQSPDIQAVAFSVDLRDGAHGAPLGSPAGPADEAFVSLPVLITESKMDCPEFDSLNSADFTFRFADIRQVSPLLALLDFSVFNGCFTSEFS